jgi:hypothetical protein
MCDHRRGGICDCRKGRHRRRQCVLQVGSGRTIPVVKDAQVGSGRTIPVMREVLRGLTLGQRERGADRADSVTVCSEYVLCPDNNENKSVPYNNVTKSVSIEGLRSTVELRAGTRRYRTRRGWTRVQSVVINSCVLNFECNKLPL